MSIDEQWKTSSTIKWGTPVNKEKDHLANTFDQLIVQLSLTSEEKLPYQHQYEYSNKFVQDEFMFQIHKLQLTELKNNISMKDWLKKIMAQAELQVEMLKPKWEGYNLHTSL